MWWRWLLDACVGGRLVCSVWFGTGCSRGGCGRGFRLYGCTEVRGACVKAASDESSEEFSDDGDLIVEDHCLVLGGSNIFEGRHNAGVDGGKGSYEFIHVCLKRGEDLQ